MTDSEILEKLQEILSYKLGVEPEEVTLEASLRYHLGADSLDMYEIPIVHLSQEFGFDCSVSEWEDVDTVGDVVKLIKKKQEEQNQSRPSNIMLFFMTRGGKKLSRKTPRKPVAKLVMPQKPMMLNPGKKR